MNKKEIFTVALITVVALGIMEIACRIIGVGNQPESDFRFYIRQVDNDLRLDYVVEDPLLIMIRKSLLMFSGFSVWATPPPLVMEFL